MDRALAGREYASHLTDADLRLLAPAATAAAGDGAWLRGDPAALRASLDGKARRYCQVLDRLESAEDPAPAVTSSPEYEAALQARRAVIDAQREELLRWRDAGHLPDASLRILERELDHEERTLPPHDAH